MYKEWNECLQSKLLDMEQEKKRELRKVAEEFKAGDDSQIQDHNSQLLNELTV